MIVTNRITKGLYESVDPSYQPEGTVVKNHNGQFIHYNDGNFKWKTAKGNKTIYIEINGTESVFSDLGLTIMAMDFMNNDLIVLSTKTSGDYLGRIIFTSADMSTGTYYHIIENIDLELNINNPIRQFICSYENENTQRVYWNDGVLSPRTLDIANLPSPIDAEMLNFTPPSEIGQINYDSEISGNLYCGSYTAVFRLISTDGAISDYSLPSQIINVGKEKEYNQVSYQDYQDYQGENFEYKSNLGIRFYLTNIDIRYKYIQVVVFKSIIENEFLEGILIYDGSISSSNLYIDYTGSENLGAITSDVINIRSRYILQANLMEQIKNKNVLADFTERSELSEGINIKYNKMLGVTIDKEIYEIPVDTKVNVTEYNYSDPSKNDPDLKPLHGVQYNSTYLYKNIWYYNNFTSSFVLGDGITTKTADHVPYLRIKKYQESNGTIIYENINLYKEFLNYKGKDVSANLKGYMGKETYRFGIVFFSKGKPYGVRWIGDREFPIRSGFWSLLNINLYNPPSGIKDNHVNAKVLSAIINNIDITELVTIDGLGNAIDCEIDGFSIVRCVLDEQIITEGLLMPMLDNNDRPVVAWPTTAYTIDRIKNVYNYYNPDYLFKRTKSNIQKGDKLIVNTYLRGWFSDRTYTGIEHVDGDNIVQKYYIDEYPVSGLPTDTETNAIEAVYNFPFDSEGNYNTIPEISRSLKNETSWNSSNANGSDCLLLVTENEELTNDNTFAPYKDYIIALVDVIREKDNLYGGTSDAALSLNKYISTGHYQEVNTTILNSIKSGGKFEFNNIQIFGGDTYICLWDLERIIKYRRNTSSTFFSHGMIFPIQSKINLDLRTGSHLSKDRSYSASNNPTGIGLEGSYIQLEDFNYNDGYSTNESIVFYLPLPYNFKQRLKYEYDLIWSEYKVLGEKTDNYRIFPVNNIKSVEHSFGKLSYIGNFDNKLIYLQAEGIGYLPIDERIMINNEANQPVQLGLGGTFERYDTTHKFYGCQHYFSVSKVPDGLVFFDFNNRAFLHLNKNMQLTDESIIKGLETTFNSLNSEYLKDNDNPFSGNGIYSFYDKKRKEAVMFFKQNIGNYITITYNYKTQTFSGTLDLFPQITNNKKEFVLSTVSGNNNLFVHEIGNLKEFYGTKYDAYLRFIINNVPSDFKIFDNFRILGNDKMFNSIYFKGENFNITENVVDNNNVLLSDYYKYINFEWRGSYPLGSEGERLRGHYIEIELTVDKDNLNNVELLNITTSNRKTE